MTRSTADTIVVGGGLIGCALAAELRERGQSVLVLERGEPGAEASSAAAGLLSPQSDARARDALFELGAESLALYPGWTARLSEETGVDCGFRRAGLLRCAFSETERESLAAAYGWQARRGWGSSFGPERRWSAIGTSSRSPPGCGPHCSSPTRRP